MTHVATAVIIATPQKVKGVTLNKATQLRNQWIAEQAAHTPSVTTRRNRPLQNRIDQFENKANIHSSQLTRSLTTESKRKNEIVYNQPTPKEKKHISDNTSIVLIRENKKTDLPKKSTEKFKVVTRNEPSLSIDVMPWTPGPKVSCVTDSNVEEVEKILAERRRLTDENCEKKATAKTVPTQDDQEITLRPFSLYSTDSDRTSTNANVDVSFPNALALAKHNIRMLWKDVEGVVNSGIYEQLDKKARTRQEAKFELMLSEGTFLHGINALEAHYIRNIRKHVPQVVSEKDCDILFKYVDDVRMCSDNFLSSLDDVWQTDAMLDGIYDVLLTHAKDKFQAYVRYCRNMLDMSEHLKLLSEKNEPFRDLIGLLVSREGGQRLTLDAFLTAPMQRITKLPLLLRTILDNVELGTDEHAKCSAAYDAIEKIAQECNEVVNERKRMEELLKLNQEIEFADETKTIPIVAPARALVSRANVRHFAFRAGATTRKEKLHLILFNDLILLTKKKGEMYVVVDHCSRDQLVIKEMENPMLIGKVNDTKQKNPVVLTLVSCKQDKKIDLVVTFKEQSLCKEWLSLLGKEGVEDEEKMIALQEHEANDDTELTLMIGDVITILAQPVDGWCTGELLSDGTKGRFPLSKTTKIVSRKEKAKSREEIKSTGLETSTD